MLILFIPFCGIGQNFAFAEGKKSAKIKFQLINNLIIFPVEVNGTPLSFILDSGVSQPIIFYLRTEDDVEIKNVSTVVIKGLGEGEHIEALKSLKNTFALKNLKAENKDLFVVLNQGIDFSPRLGIPVHGIMGYSLFKEFVVEINYAKKWLKLHDPEYYVASDTKKRSILPLRISNKKAFVEANVLCNRGKTIPVSLLIDTGSSDALWLFENNDKGLAVPTKYFNDHLGLGFSGNIFGKRSRMRSFEMGGYELFNVKASFPEMEAFDGGRVYKDRNGSLGGEILKRFNIVFNYKGGTISFKKNGYFKNPFNYNMSGIQLQHDGMRYISESIADSRGVVINENSREQGTRILLTNEFKLKLVPEIAIAELREGSPAKIAGLLEGDILKSVNGKSVYKYKLQEVIGMLNERVGKKMRVTVEREGVEKRYSFTLENVL